MQYINKHLGHTRLRWLTE